MHARFRARAMLSIARARKRACISPILPKNVRPLRSYPHTYAKYVDNCQEMWINGLSDTFNEHYRNNQQSTIFQAQTNGTSTSTGSKDLLSGEEVLYDAYRSCMFATTYAYLCSRCKLHAWLYRVP